MDSSLGPFGGGTSEEMLFLSVILRISLAWALSRFDHDPQTLLIMGIIVEQGDNATEKPDRRRYYAQNSISFRCHSFGFLPKSVPVVRTNAQRIRLGCRLGQLRKKSEIFAFFELPLSERPRLTTQPVDGNYLGIGRAPEFAIEVKLALERGEAHTFQLKP